MRRSFISTFALTALVVAGWVSLWRRRRQANSDQGILLENLNWITAEAVLNRDAIVVLPLGACLKEHGPHLKLKNDWIIAEYFKKQVLATEAVVMLPTVPYHYYPAFVEYPGSTSLAHKTACDLIVQIVSSIAKFGPRKFYVINTGVSTIRPLKESADILHGDEITLAYTDLTKDYRTLIADYVEQEGGTHADEVETSLMLYIAPHSVDMSQAARDYNEDRLSGALTRRRKGHGVYSPTGIWGDATLASKEKGRIFAEAYLQTIRKDLALLRSS